MRIIGNNHAIWPTKEYINKNIKNYGSTRRDFYSQRAKTIINYTEQVFLCSDGVINKCCENNNILSNNEIF